MKTNKQQTAALLTIIAMMCIIVAFISVIAFKNSTLFGAGLAVAFISVSIATILNPSHK